jgi:dolichol-phosphate mannosyltransferase
MNQRISVVLPTYNESQNIPVLIDEISKSITDDVSMGDLAEIIVVDDNSPDGTAAICRSLGDTHRSVNVIVRTNERGLGSAVKRGILESSGEIVLVMDADFSHDCAVVPRLLAALDSDSTDIAIASRYTHGGNMTASPHLSIGSRVLNLFIRTVLGMPVKDITGGFIAVRRTSLEGLNFDTIFTGYGDYCIALLYKGFKKGWRFQEIPFSYHPRRNGMSKTSFLKTGFSYGIRALKLRVGLE